jgi:hypothetical protein
LPVPGGRPEDGGVPPHDIPEEDLYPHHRYGNYTHTSAGGYAFEWTPFRPAIVAWENAERYLRSAVKNLRTARELTGFALNGLDDEYARMITCLEEYATQAETTRSEAAKVVGVLEIADKEYAAANEDSAEQYLALMKRIDEVTAGQGVVRGIEDEQERLLDEYPGSLPYQG